MACRGPRPTTSAFSSAPRFAILLHFLRPVVPLRKQDAPRVRQTVCERDALLSVALFIRQTRTSIRWSSSSPWRTLNFEKQVPQVLVPIPTPESDLMFWLAVSTRPNRRPASVVHDA